MRKLLLIQVRAPADPMARHETACIERRLHPRRVGLRVENVFASRPTRRWLDGVDALVIGGSGSFSVQDPRSAEFVGPMRRLLDRALDEQLPGFAICFGHQLLGLHLGARVETDEERRESGTVPFTLTEHGARDPLFAELGPTFRGHTGHTDHVLSAPQGTELLARNDRCEVQALRVRGAPFYSTQFHPDLTAEEARSRYRSFARGLPAAARARVAKDVSRFDPDADDTDRLLGRFVDRLVGGTS